MGRKRQPSPPLKVPAIASFANLTAGPRPVLNAAGSVILSFLRIKHDARPLRLACSALREAIADQPWSDADIEILNVARWHASFPNALTANLRGRVLKSADISALARVRTLNLSRGQVPESFSGMSYQSLTRLDLS